LYDYITIHGTKNIKQDS